MFQIGEFVVYGYSEVCRIKDIAVPDFLDTKESYYYLQPLCSATSILYVKVSGPSKVMRRLISRKQAEDALAGFEKLDALYDDNEKFRLKEYSEIFHACDFGGWMRMLKGILTERERRAQSGRKLNMVDEKNLNKVQSCVAAEFSQVLQIPVEQAKDYLHLAAC